MSSDSNQLLPGIKDLCIIKAVLRYTGFQYQKPVCELDCNAARYAFEPYQNGMREPDVLIAAVSMWAERHYEHRDQTTVMGGNI